MRNKSVVTEAKQINLAVELVKLGSTCCTACANTPQRCCVW